MFKPKITVILLIFIFDVLLSSRSILAATYYVAANGNNGNPCSLAQPCATIIKGASLLVAGDMLYIRGGTYNETVEIAKSGTASIPITISGYPGETVVVDGQDTIPASDWGTLFRISGNYVVVRDLTVQRSKWIGLELEGQYDQAINVKSYENMETGILVRGNYSIVDGCEIRGNAKRNQRPGGPYGAGGWASGLSAARHPQHVTLRNNKSWNNWGEGISTFEAEYTTIEGNIAWDNWSTNYYISDTKYTIVQRNISYWTSSMTGSMNGGIWLGDETYNPASSDNKIINNFVKGGDRCFYSWIGANGGGLVNVLIANNTFVNSNPASESNVKILAGTHRNTIFKNNIMEQDDSVPAINIEGGTSGITFGYNLWSKTPLGYASGINDVIGDPKLTKSGPTGPGLLTPDWFKISANSPAKDKADVIAEVSEDFFRNPRGPYPDIGGHEYAGSGGPPKPPTNLRIIN